MSASHDMTTPEERSLKTVAGDLAERLDLALRLALQGGVFNPDPAESRKARRRILAAVTSDDPVALEGSSTELDDFYALTAPLIHTPRGPRPNAIWLDPAFVSPVIAALAQFFDRCLDPFGESAFTLEVEAVPDSLAGYALRDISSLPVERNGLTGGVSERVLTDDVTLRISTLLASAAHLILDSPMADQFFTMGANYLASEARREAGEWQEGRDSLTGGSAFIRSVLRDDLA